MFQSLNSSRFTTLTSSSTANLPTKQFAKQRSSQSCGLQKYDAIGMPLSGCKAKLSKELSTITTSLIGKPYTIRRSLMNSIFCELSSARLALRQLSRQTRLEKSQQFGSILFRIESAYSCSLAVNITTWKNGDTYWINSIMKGLRKTPISIFWSLSLKEVTKLGTTPAP